MREQCHVVIATIEANYFFTWHRCGVRLAL